MECGASLSSGADFSGSRIKSKNNFERADVSYLAGALALLFPVNYDTARHLSHSTLSPHPSRTN